MKVYKGLNSKTKVTYYNEDGKLTDIDKKLFRKDAQRSEWNTRNRNIFKDQSDYKYFNTDVGSYTR